MKNRVIGTGSHAGLGIDANRFIKSTMPSGRLNICGCRASGYTRRVRTTDCIALLDVRGVPVETLLRRRA